MSLANRIIIGLQSVLVIVAVLGSLAFYASYKRVREADQHRLLQTRLTWLQTGIEFDVEDRELELDSGKAPSDCAPYWKVETTTGKLLWSDPAGKIPDETTVRTHKMGLGRQDGESPADEEIVKGAGVEEGEDDDDGETELAKYELGYAEYRLPKGSNRVELVLTVAAPTAAMEAELAGLARTLWLAVPTGLILTGLLLALLVRWQLKPLTLMSAKAAEIGPGNIQTRIDTPGSAKEYAQLRGSINGMLGRLEEGLQRERQFASGAAHELRTPVAQLRTAIEVALRKERSDKEYREVLEGTLTDVERLQNLLAGLLKLTRADSAPLEAGECVEASTLVSRVHDRYPDTFVNTDAETDDLRVSANEELAVASISNVIENALRYAPVEPPCVRFVKDKGALEVIVEDRGPGIEEADRDRIFEPLFRLDKARTIDSAEDGFGLGLSVARSILRGMGGDLFCRSRADGEQGAAFVLRFRKAA